MTKDQASGLWFYLTNQNEDSFWALGLKTPNIKCHHARVTEEDIPTAVEFLREFADSLEGKNESSRPKT